MPGTVHVIGAGLAGLAAAVRLAQADTRLVLHEAAGQAGGRCRSYHDRALEMVIDNGNHLLLSGNDAALSYLRTVGAEKLLAGPPVAEFPFVDMANGQRWTLRLNPGRLPWWVFDSGCRVPETSARDYFLFARLLWASPRKTICQTIGCEGPVYQDLVRPFLLAALNTDPTEGSALLACAVVRETLARGGAACRPLIARCGLARVFIEPALRYLSEHNVEIRFGHRLRRIELTDGSAVALEFGEDKILVPPDDAVILAVPPSVAADLVPGLTVPTQFRAIVNAHFRVTPPPALASIIGIVNGTAEWLFAFPDRLSVTISAADRLVELPREALASTIWQEVALVSGLPKELPPWQIVRERRATFAATVEENAKRPAAETPWRNLFLAGDWTRTGLPATIEGAVRSGYRAADLVGRA